jgi:hypothetical protein
MIILDATAESLQVKLSVATTTSPVEITTSFIDITPTTFTPINFDTTVAVNTDVEIVAAPALSTQRQVKHITVYNADTVATTVTIKKDTSGSDKTLCVVTLAVNDTLQYSSGRGFSVISASDGSIKIQPQTPLGISANSQSVSTGTMIFSNSNSLSFGLSGSSLMTASFGRLSMSFYENQMAELQANSMVTGGAVLTLSFQRIYIPYDITVTRLDLLAVVTSNVSVTWTISAGVYTRSRSTLFSASTTNTNLNFTASGASNNSNSFEGASGTRWRSMSAGNWAFTPGEYWFGFMVSFTPAEIRIYGQSSVSVQLLAGGVKDIVGIDGIYSVATSAFPAQVDLSRTEIYFGHSAAASASQVLRQPYFRMFGTY